jgi:hypothetical protein
MQAARILQMDKPMGENVVAQLLGLPNQTKESRSASYFASRLPRGSAATSLIHYQARITISFVIQSRDALMQVIYKTIRFRPLRHPD